jgi:phosphate transport system substrate-binding protein
MGVTIFGIWRASGVAAAAAGVLALTGCGPAAAPNGGGGTQMFTVIVDGSSTVYPISEAAGEAYQRDQAGRVRVTVAESGTGGGFRKFCRDETHVQGASRPILAAEIEACRAAGVSFIELPIAFDALSVVVHPENPLKDISVDDLKKIWAPEAQGQITNWRQVNAAFPDLALSLYGPGTASGTFDYFTEAVVGKAKSSRNDYTPSEDDNVLVQGLSSDKGGLGYFGMSYYTENRARVRALGVSYKGGAPVYPTAETVQSGAYQPLSRPLFVYINAKALNVRPVQAFVDYYLANAAKLATDVGFVPLPANAYQIAADRVAKRQTGTGFGGVQDVGGNIDEVLARPLVDAPPAPTTAPAEPAKK